MTGDAAFRPAEPHVPDEAHARLKASRELGKIYRALKAMRVFLWTIAVCTALLAAFLLLVWLNASPIRRGFPFAMSISAVTALTLSTAALRLHREPVLWGWIATTLQTISAVYLLLTAGLLIKIIAVVLAMGCCAATTTIAPLGKKLREHPDLRIARKISGSGRS